MIPCLFDKGFTLIELLVTMAITLIFAFLAYSTFSDLLQKKTLDHNTHRFFHALQFARTEAIKHNQIVTLCPSKDLLHCENTWQENNMIIFKENPFTLLRVETHFPFDIHQTGKEKQIQFTGEGRSLTRSTLTLQIAENQVKRIVVYDSGRARVK